MNNSSVIVVVTAVLPALLLLLYIRYRDREQPEPTALLIRGFMYGVAAVFLSLSFSSQWVNAGLVPLKYTNPFEAVEVAFVSAAIPEELAKLLMLWALLRKNPYFDEHFDGVVYAVCVGLGFATFENIGYLFSSEDWASVAVARAIFSVPGHFFFAVLMGYYYSLAHFGHRPWRNRVLMVVAPIVAHGIFDSLLMTQDVLSESAPEAFVVCFTLAFLLFCNELRKLSVRHIRELLEHDKRWQA